MDRTGIVRSVDATPQIYARLGGGLYLAIIALGIVAQVVVRDQLVNGLTVFLAPAFAGPVFLVIMLPVFIGETSVSLWLLIKGVNVERWHQAAGSGRPTP